MLDWQKHTKLRIFIKTICIVLITAFLSYDLSWAGATEVLNPKNWHTPQESQDSPAIEIPQELGTIKESYTSKYNPHKLVVHIQDAHANVEAQENEAKLIKYLNDKYKVNLVSVEGGFGDFDAEFFRSFPKDKKVRDKIAKYFLSKAFISGSDYLLITENKPPTVYGAEDKELYTAHLNTFKDNQTTADSLNKSLDTLEGVIETLKAKHYSKDLKELDSKANDFRLGRISLEEYLSYLNIASIINNVDLSKFPNLYSLITSQELEHKINFEKAEAERQDLIESLAKALSKTDLEELVRNSLEFKANKLTPREYYAYLEKLTQKADIGTSTYTNLFTYIKYISLSEKLDNARVFEEIDNFTQQLKDKLTTSSTQKDIDNLAYIIRILKGLSNINLSPKEYENFKKTKEEFNQRRLAQLFRRYVDSSYVNSLPSDGDIASLEKFYDIAHDRDRAIVSNSLNRLNREYNTNSVILVAGGFHTQGITSILKEKDISYIVVAPNIKQSQDKETTYFALLKDKKLPLEDVLNDPDTLQIINSISDNEARQLLITYWIARASRYYSAKELKAQLNRLNLSAEDETAVQLALKKISSASELAREEVAQQEERIVAFDTSKEKSTVAVSSPVQKGPSLLENFALFISSLKPKPKRVTLVKKERQEIILPKSPSLYERAVSFIVSLKTKPKQKQAPASHGKVAKDAQRVNQEVTKVPNVSRAIQHPRPKQRLNYKPFLSIITGFTFALYLPSVALAQGKDAATKTFSSFTEFLTQPVVILVSIGLGVGYLIFRLIKKFTTKENRPVAGAITTAPPIQPQVQPIQPRFIRQPETPQQLQNNIPAALRHELEMGIQQLNDLVAQTSRDALVGSFRPTGPAELPLPLPLTMLNQYASDRDKIVHILENMQRMMDGTDEKVLRDFERAIDNARDRVTEQALEQFDVLSNEQIYQLLTQGYLTELQREFQRIIENQIQHMIRFHAPSFEEQNLYVSEDINERYSRLPRYLKWLLTNNPQLENDPLVRDWLSTIQMRMSQIPAFPEMIRDYSRRALNKSLYLNPELAMRVILYLSRGGNLDSLSESQARSRIQQELARNLPEDVVITDVSIEEEEEGTLELPQAPQPRSLPAPDIEKTDSLKARLKAIIEEYQRFLTKFTEQEALVRKAESDLAELSEGLEEAKRQNDKVIITALKPAVEGLSSKLRRAKEAFSRLEQEKARYEEQINQIRRESGKTGGTVLYAVDPLSLGIGAVFAVMFGIPLYITKKILNKRYNTTAGKTFGILASLSTTILGYYAYYTSLTPKIQEVFTDFSHADWLQLATFFIIWPIAIIAGILGGKFGKGISHERLYWKANSAFKSGRIDEAITLIDKAIKQHPKDAVDFRLLAECQRSKKRFDEAIAAYQKALEFEPNNSSTHNNLGVVYVEKGNDAKGIECYRRSLELDSNDPMVLSNLGRALHKKGQLLEAARVLQKAQQIKPDASVTEELNEILQQTGRVPKAQRPTKLEYGKTLAESLRLDKEETWLVGRYGMREEAWWSVILGWALGAFLMWMYPYGQHWNLGTTEHPTWIGITVWVVEIVVMPFTGLLQLWFMEKFVDGIRKVYRFLKFPLNYRKLERVNLLPSDELSDSDLKSVAPIYARMSKEYLERVFRSWVEVGHEEKISRLFKFGKWKQDKIRIYADLGEYRKTSRVAATKFTHTTEEQKALFDSIDRQKERLTQKGISNAVGLFKDILPQIVEHSRSSEEFIFWLNLVVDLPQNIWNQGTRQILVVFNDLREFNRQQEEAVRKFSTNSQEQTRVTKAIDGLKAKLDKEGLNSAGILKAVLAEVNKASRNLNEFLFWINELMQFDKRIWSSGSQLGLLQNLIAYVRTKEEADKKLCKSPEETSRLFQTVDSLREEIQKKGVSGDVSILKDVVPRVAEASRDFAEFLEYIAVLKAFDKNIWYGTQSVLQAFNNHVAYKQARENAAAKFTQNDASRQKFLSEIDNLRAQLVQKGFPQASDLLKDILPELTKTCRSKGEFVYWLGELVGLNISVWRSGAQAVINNFNDLAGFKQAKEIALEKLCSNQQEKDELTKTIDSLKAKLEEKRPSCAGLIKDVVLEILKDIDRLSDPPFRRTDFIYWLSMCVNFEAAVWHAGIKQVLAGYQELKDYKKQRQELFAKFTSNTEEQKRLTVAWDGLEKAVNFSRVSTISLLKNTVAKISDFATTPREFVFWIGSLSELNSEVLEVFCRDIDTAFAYYREKGKARDFNHLPAVLNQYHKTYHQTVLITANLLDILTDSGIDIDKRVERASKFIVEQKIVKLGAPPNLVGLRDAVSFEQLLAIAGEGGFSSILNFHWQEESSDSEYGSSYYDTSNQPIRQIVPKMGQDGMYSYWEAHRPPYYQQFLEETKGLAPGFNHPGEKFRVAYDDRVVSWTREEETQIMPITDHVQALKQLIQYLRMEWPNLYENFIEPKRELIKGRPLEEFVTSETVEKMTQQLLGKVQNWQFSEQQRAVFLIKIMEIFAFFQTSDLRVRIANATDDFNKLRLVGQYWERVLELILKHKWLQEKSKFFQSISKIIKQRVAAINDKLGDGGEGVLQFYLSGGTVADFFRGLVSCDCTKPGGQAFQTTIGTVIDPGFFLFKIIENGKWVGNIYSVVFKTQDGKFALFVDVFQINLSHPLVAQGDNWNGKRDKFVQAFFKELKSYLASQGFDYLIFANTHSSQKIGTNIHNEIVKESGKSSAESLSLKKPGGLGHLSEGGLSVEYVQGVGNISGSFQGVSGYKIALDKTTPQVMQQKQRDLDYLEKLLGEMSTEETRLLNLLQERQLEFNQINKRGQEAANSGKNTLAQALKTASDQKKAEIQKVEYELQELRLKIKEKKQEAERLRTELGMLSSGRSQRTAVASSPATEVLSLIPLAILFNIFATGRAQAQGFTPVDDLLYSPWAPFLFVGGAIGVFGILYWLLNKLFPPKPQEMSYYERPFPQKPLFEEYKLPEDVRAQLDKVLDKVSGEVRELIPKHIDIRIPYEVGILRGQAVKALKLLFATLIENKSVLDFFKGSAFYQRFKSRTEELGLSDGFDQPNQSYFFTVPKEQIRFEEDRRAEEFIDEYLNRLKRDFSLRAPEDGNVEPKIFRLIAQERSRLRRKGFYKGTAQLELQEYYRLLKAAAYLRFKDNLDDVATLLTEHKYLEVLSYLEEFLRVGVGAELIALEQDANFREVLNRLLEREVGDIRWQFNRSAAFQAKKQQVIREAQDIQFEIRLSDRNADDILRGVASGDCTAINGSAFYNTIPQFLFDPGLLVFKVIQDNKWVGNVYGIVAERDGEPVLIIDAIQLPVWGRSWPISVKELADKVLEKTIEYAQTQGFNQVLMSSFVSNFSAIHDHLAAKYSAKAIEIEKVEGFEHLKALGLWDEYAMRNEYLETFSPQWNYGLKKVNPNIPKQVLLLREVWKRTEASESTESPLASSQISSPIEQKAQDLSVRPRVTKLGFWNAFSYFMQRKLRPIVIGAVLILMLSLPNIAHAAKFEVVPGPTLGQTQVVAIVEQGDTDWDIAGIAYQDVEGIGEGRYAAHMQWPKIYEANPQIHNRPNNALRPMYPDGDYYKDDRHIIINIRPGDRLVIPGAVNYEAMGLKAPAPQTEITPPVSETKPPEVSPSQQQTQTQQELHNLQQQKSQVEQELTQLQQQRQAAQADLENLQREKAELTRQILELKKQLADIQEQLSQAKEKIPPSLQTEEAQRQVLQEELRHLEQKKAQYAQEIANLERQYKEAQDDLSRIAAQREKANQELEQLRQQTPQAQTQIKDLQAEIQRLENQKKQHQEELNQLQNQRDELQKGIDQLNQDKNKLQNELQDLRQQISDAKKLLDEARQKAQPSWKNLWDGLSWPEKTGIIFLLLTGIGAIGGGIVLLRRWRKFKQLEEKISKLQKEAEDLEAKLTPLRTEKDELMRIKQDAEKKRLEAQEEAQRVAQQAQIEAERKRLAQDAEIQKAEAEVKRLQGEAESLQKDIAWLTEEKSKIVEELEGRITALKAEIAQKQALLQEPPAPTEVKESITEVDVGKAVEFLRSTNTKMAQTLLKSQRINLRERISFIHNELGFDIANGQGRSLLTRNPQTLREQKTFLQGLGLPLTVSNLSSSKRSFAKKELKQIIMHPEWQELTNEEKLSVVSHLYDIYGLRLSWLSRDNDWYQLLHYFDLAGEPINYTPRSIDFIQKYELARFQKFRNIRQTKARLSKIKEVIEILGLKVYDLLNTVKTKEGFELYVVKPEVYEGKLDYDRQYYPLPKTPFIIEGMEISGEVEEGEIEPEEALVTPELEQKLLVLKQEIEQREKEFIALEEEKQKKATQFEQEIQTLTGQRDKLKQEIEQLEKDIQTKRQELSLAVSEASQLEKEQAEVVRGLKRETDEQRELIKTLEEQRDKARQELADLEKQKQTVRDEIKQLEAQRDSLKGGLIEAQSQVKEAIRKARELEEESKTQAQITLTDEQRKIQEQVEAKRQEVATQIGALEERLRQARVKQQLDLAEIEQARTKAQEELSALILERDRVKKELENMNITVSKLQTERDRLLTGLQELDKQQKQLQQSIEQLRQEEAKLKTGIEELKKAEEIKPKVEILVEEAIKLDEETNALLGKIAPLSDTHIHRAVIKQIEGTGIKNIKIESVPIKSHSGHNNIILKIPASDSQYEHLPKIILNAHIDTVRNNGFWFIFRGRKEQVKSGALDDRVGVVAILQSLRMLKQKWEVEKVPHGPVWIIFTDLEEPPDMAAGSRDLKRRHETKSDELFGLFNNTHVVITVDGPLDQYRGTDKPLREPLGLVLLRPEKNTYSRYYSSIDECKHIQQFQTIYQAGEAVSGRVGKLSPWVTPQGGGDEGVFASIQDKNGEFLRVANIRAPHTGYHSPDETTDIENYLVPVIDLLVESVLRLSNQLIRANIGSAKGQGMLLPEEHSEVNDVILSAQKEGRGLLIWGNANGWQNARTQFERDIAWAIASLKRYPALNIPGLGRIDIPEIITASNIILILPHNNSPPGLLVKDRNNYLIAHNGLTMNSIYIDEVTYKRLYSFEIAVLLAHEAIQLGAKRLAWQKGVPWTSRLAEEVNRLAEEYEIRIVGRSDNGRGSRFDDRIEEILGFNRLKAAPRYEQEEEPQDIMPPKMQKIEKQEPKDNQALTIEYPEDDKAQEILKNLRNLFLEGLFRDIGVNLPARLEDFPAPIAQEIRQSYQLDKIKGMPLDAELMAALALFFSRLFPNHANKLLNYLRNLRIYLIDNARSTFGATLSGNTFYIQRSCIQDLLGRPVSVEEIYQGIQRKDKQILVALFRIIVHEIGSAFYKMSHPANQDLERLFLALLTKTRINLSPQTQQEITTVNNTLDLDNLARIDWAEKRTPKEPGVPDEVLSTDNLFFITKELPGELINALYHPNQNVRDETAEALTKLGCVEALPYLKLLLEREPTNERVRNAVSALEQKSKDAQDQKLKAKLQGPFIKALFTIDADNNLVFTPAAIQAINTLFADYNGLTLEIDVDTLIDTASGMPQLKGLGFKEALVSLYQAQQKKQIPENLRVRLININSSLDKKKIIKVLGLTEELVDKLVFIPDIPQDYLIKGLEPYLVEGSIRIIFEDNLQYWGKKIDVLVKRGNETETLSSLGLIVAGLAKEPKFYESLPQDVKEYIVAVTDEKGNIALDDENKIKQLIFKPIEKSKVDMQYLDKLDKANKELEGMV
jgi:tetratricopeptide (TPR) repeat protein/predicted  nucleic acid-binding Zn-ribbon protein